ncbi:hypothetical protein GFK82_00368 [Candidatus Steffania adelgidicola]|nr:hypothetical protein GFK82_00368 [Candidatus Steffania adelgidicola]
MMNNSYSRVITKFWIKVVFKVSHKIVEKWAYCDGCSKESIFQWKHYDSIWIKVVFIY